MTKTKQPLSVMLQQKLEEALGYPVNIPERTRAGKHQISAFSWSWSTKPSAGGIAEIGSIFPMRHCVAASSLEIKRLARTVAMFDVRPK